MDLQLPIRAISGTFGMARLPATAPFPAWLEGEPVCFVSRGPTGLSIIAPAPLVQSLLRAEETFRLLTIDMVFGTTETGVLASMLVPLAGAGVWVLALGAYDTDFVLVREDQFDLAVAALRRAGHTVTTA